MIPCSKIEAKEIVYDVCDRDGLDYVLKMFQFPNVAGRVGL